jgi:hypothetical protein
MAIYEIDRLEANFLSIIYGRLERTVSTGISPQLFNLSCMCLIAVALRVLAW